MPKPLDERLLVLVTERRGHFTTVEQLAKHVVEPAVLVRQELDRLYIMLIIDRFDVITSRGTTSHYGLHRGVDAGQARKDNIIRRMQGASNA